MDCYNNPPLSRGVVPAFVERPDASFVPIEKATLEDFEFAIRLEDSAIDYHRGRRTAFLFARTERFGTSS